MSWLTGTGRVLIPVLLVTVSGCAEVGRAVTTARPTPGLDPIAVMPQGTDVDLDARPTATLPPSPRPSMSAPGEGVGTAAPVPGGTPDAGCPDGCLDVAAAEAAIARATSPVIIAVDASVDMDEPFGATTRLDATRDGVQRLLLGTPGFVDVGLMTFGAGGDGTDAGRSESCSTISTLAFPGDTSPADVDGLTSVGWRPVASLLDIAVPVLQEVGRGAGPIDSTTPGRIVLLTAGGDSCGRDAADVLVGLQAPPVVDVVALGPTAAGGIGTLQQLADVSGGVLHEVTDVAGLRAAVDALSARPSGDLMPAWQAPPEALVSVLAELQQQAQEASRALAERDAAAGGGG